jgi:hypothetical protein
LIAGLTLLQDNISKKNAEDFKTIAQEFKREGEQTKMGICCVYKERWRQRKKKDKEYRRNKRSDKRSEEMN